MGSQPRTGAHLVAQAGVCALYTFLSAEQTRIETGARFDDGLPPISTFIDGKNHPDLTDRRKLDEKKHPG